MKPDSLHDMQYANNALNSVRIVKIGSGRLRTTDEDCLFQI
jgi:hypothetical protein